MKIKRSKMCNDKTKKASYIFRSKSMNRYLNADLLIDIVKLHNMVFSSISLKVLSIVLEYQKYYERTKMT